jgi:hypothetical protein
MVPMTEMESRKAAAMRPHSRLSHSNLFIQSNPKPCPKGFSGGAFFYHQALMLSIRERIRSSRAAQFNPIIAALRSQPRSKSVGKVTKTVTCQKVDPDACLQVAGVTSRISRLEGMDGHARAADARLRK